MDLKPKIIAIEGPDGAGKTTLARNLAAALGAVYLKRPAQGSAAHRAFLDPSVTRAELIGLMRADCRRALEDAHMAHDRTGGPPIILDRHYLSCAIYQGGAQDWRKILAEDVAEFGHPRAWVIVTAQAADIYVRLRRRVDDAHANMGMAAICERLELYREARLYLEATAPKVIDYHAWAHSITATCDGATCTVMGSTDKARQSAAAFVSTMVRT